MENMSGLYPNNNIMVNVHTVEIATTTSRKNPNLRDLKNKNPIKGKTNKKAKAKIFNSLLISL
jgi:hypothetical protein